MTKDQIIELRKKHFIAPAVTYYKEPLQLVRAKGQFVFDEKGREYLDCVGGIVTISAGHNHPKIKEKLMKMLNEDEIQHTTVLYLNHHVTELTEALMKDAPKNLDRVFFTNSGSEANEVAFMAARQATGETTIVHLRHSYHGCTSGALAACGHHTWRFKAQPVSQMTSAIEPNCYRCPYQKTPTSCALECAKDVERTIQTTTHGKIAGMIVEPVMGVGGFITPPDEYFPEVTKIVHKYGGKFISDEVQTGAGRCGGDIFLTKSLGIDADMVTMAKGFGNGAAIGATLLTTEISDSMKGKAFFNTFGGDPYQTTQAKLTLEIIREEKLVQNAKEVGSYLKDGMTQLMKTHALIGDVRGRGLLLGMELVKDRNTKEYATQETLDLMEKCREKGVLVGRGGLFGNVLRVAPPLTITKKDADRLLKAIDESLKEIASGKS